MAVGPPRRRRGRRGAGEDSIITQTRILGRSEVGMLRWTCSDSRSHGVHDAGNMNRDRTGTVDGDRLASTTPRATSCFAPGARRCLPVRIADRHRDAPRNALRTVRRPVASNALLRPGPLDAGMHTVFIKRKLGQEKVSYPHPSLREVLEPTYGVITYQEQVMRIANVIAGFSLAEADVLRKAVGKKDAELIRKELGKFCERGAAQGHPKKLLDELAAQIETFGRYGFNKSHSVAYSVLSYQTAWLKAHHPAEFMAALLREKSGQGPVVQYLNGPKTRPRVLPPDVNESGSSSGRRRWRVRFGSAPFGTSARARFESIIAAAAEKPSSRRRFSRADRPGLCNKSVVDRSSPPGACEGLAATESNSAKRGRRPREAQRKQQERRRDSIALRRGGGPRGLVPRSS